MIRVRRRQMRQSARGGGDLSVPRSVRPVR